MRLLSVMLVAFGAAACGERAHDGDADAGASGDTNGGSSCSNVGEDCDEHECCSGLAYDTHYVYSGDGTVDYTFCTCEERGGGGDTADDEDGDGSPAPEDCDDADADVHPGAAEICDGIDNDCDGGTDEGVLSTYYADADGDGYGDAASPWEACEEPDGAASNASDCDDGDPSMYPGAAEICDLIDNDCDGESDEGC